MSNALVDGLNPPDVLASGGVDPVEIADEAVTAAKQGFVGTGSPTGFGLSVQTGDYVSDAGSSATVQFGTAFAAAPTVVVHAAGGLASQPSASAGSVVIETTAASSSGSWIAIGSGAI